MGSTGINPMTGLPWRPEEMQQANQNAGQQGYYVSNGGGAFAPQATPTLGASMAQQQSFQNNPYLSSPEYLAQQAKMVAGGNQWVDANSNLSQEDMDALIYAQLRPDDPTIAGMSNQQIMDMQNNPATGANASFASYGMQPGAGAALGGGMPGQMPSAPNTGNMGGGGTYGPPITGGPTTPPIGAGPMPPPIGAPTNGQPAAGTVTPGNYPPLGGGASGTGAALPPIKFGDPYTPTIPMSTRSALAKTLADGEEEKKKKQFLNLSPFWTA